MPKKIHVSLLFRFELEERHTWLAASLEEKDAFLKVVQTMCERYNVGRKTKFLNLKPAEVILGEAASARGQVTIYGVSSPVLESWTVMS